jgi:hypothetical protein
MTKQEQDKAIAELFDRINAKGWPESHENHELCMERAREFLDGLKVIFPHA